MLVSQGPTNAILNRHRWGYHLRSFKYENRSLSLFPSGILHFPLVASPSLKLPQSKSENRKPHQTSIDRKGPIMRALSTTRLLPIAYTTKHSILSFTILS
jgi:hypothetical protein